MLRNGDFVIPLYCFDPLHFAGSNHFGFEKTAQHRAKFLLESVEDLRQTLSKQGTDLIVRHQSPVEAVKGELSDNNNVTIITTTLQQQR